MGAFGGKDFLIELKLWQRLFIIFNCILFILFGLVMIQTQFTVEYDPHTDPIDPIFGVFLGLLLLGGCLVGLYISIRKESFTFTLPKTPVKFFILFFLSFVLTTFCIWGFFAYPGTPDYSLAFLIGIFYFAILTYLFFKGMQLYGGPSVKSTLPPKICTECRFANKSDSTRCTNCGALLSLSSMSSNDSH